MKLVSFLIVLHSLIFFAGANDLIQTQSGAEQQNKEFVQKFSDNSTQAVDPGDTSEAGIFDQIRITAKALPFIGFIYEIFSAPYVFIGGTGMPQIFVMMFQGLLGFFETVVIASYIRGYNF